MIPVNDHELRRASADCWLCQCGFAVFSNNEREAKQRHNQHVEEIRKHRAHVKDCQKNKVQSDLGGDTQDTHWGSPFRQGVIGNR